MDGTLTTLTVIKTTISQAINSNMAAIPASSKGDAVWATRFDHGGVSYLKDSNNNLYSEDDGELVGKWYPDTGEIITYLMWGRPTGGLNGEVRVTEENRAVQLARDSAKAWLTEQAKKALADDEPPPNPSSRLFPSPERSEQLLKQGETYKPFVGPDGHNYLMIVSDGPTHGDLFWADSTVPFACSAGKWDFDNECRIPPSVSLQCNAYLDEDGNIVPFDSENAAEGEGFIYDSSYQPVWEQQWHNEDKKYKYYNYLTGELRETMPDVPRSNIAWEEDGADEEDPKAI